MRVKKTIVLGVLMTAVLLISGCTQSAPRDLSDLEETAVVQTLTAMAPTLPPPTETPTPA